MKQKRTLSILLVLTLLITCAPWTAAAAASMEESVGTEATTPTTEQPVVEETPLPLLEADTVPETMEYADAVAQNHILRLYGEEGNDLNRVVFLNRDGSRTMYLYDYPVKYVDSNGSIRDISLDIADSNTPLSKYETAANSTVTSFSEKLSDGISLSGNGVSIRLVPVQPALQPGQSLTATAEAVAQRIDSKTVEYRYDAKTTIEYSLTYTGFKEDIVVSEYTGQTEYHFFLYTGGLSLTQIDGSYFLTDDDENIKASIGDIIVFTADERNNTFGRLESAIIKDKQIYQLTIVLDAEYLSDPNTAYPIRIDPEIRIDYELYGSAAIEDVTLHSAGTSYPRYTVLTVGTSEKGKSRLLLRIPKINGYDFSQLSGATVTSAWINLRDIMCESTSMNVTCYPYTGEAWEEDTAQWGDLAQDWGEALDSYAISYSNGLNQPIDHWYRFHIESLVQAWIDGEADQNQGVIFKADDSVESGNTLLYKTFGSYELSAYKPSFVLNYLLDMTLNYTEKDIGEGDSFTLTASTAEGPLTNVIWSSSDPSTATVSSTGVVTGIQAGMVIITASRSESGVTQSAYCIVYITIPDGVYYIRNANSMLYLQTNGSIDEYTQVYQNTKHSTSASVFEQLTQMWKIEYLGSGGYSIRPMYKLNMALRQMSEEVNISSIGTDDSLASVPIYATWTISKNINGIIFRDSFIGSRALQIEGASKQSGAEAVYSTAYNTSTKNCRWLLVPVENPPSGLLFYDIASGVPLNYTPTVVEIEIYDNYSFKNAGIAIITYSPDGITQDYTWTSENPEIATVHENTGEITGLGLGTTWITGVNDLGFTISLFVRVKLPDGIYYIENIGCGQFLSALDTYDNNAVCKHLSDNRSRKWMITHTSLGYYLIQSLSDRYAHEFSSPHYLTVFSNSDDWGEEIVVDNEVFEPVTRWKITVSESGNYILMPETGEVNNYVLTSDINTVEKLTHQYPYRNDDTYDDEWMLYKIEKESDVELEEQQKTNWCWAATARMFAKHYYPDVLIEQAEAVGYIKGFEEGEPKNLRAWNDQAAKAIQYYISQTTDAVLDIEWDNHLIYTKEIVLRFLDEGHVLYAVLAEGTDLDSSLNVESRHAVLICGYVRRKNDIRLIIKDPNDKIYFISYEKLFCGSNPQEGEVASNIVWSGVLSVRTSYSDNLTYNYFYSILEGE